MENAGRLSARAGIKVSAEQDATDQKYSEINSHLGDARATETENELQGMLRS